MKALEFPFTRNGYRYELLKREGPICLVRKTSVQHGHQGLEVVKLHQNPDKQMFGQLVLAHESYPSTAECGGMGSPIYQARARGRPNGST